MYTKEQLDFAYKYPFSSDAKQIIKELDFKTIEQMHLITGKARLEEAFENNKIEYRTTSYGKLEFVIGYAYARMLVSALKNITLVTKYANAEAKRSADALEKDSIANIVKLAKELGIEIGDEKGKYVLDFTQFLANAPMNQEFALVNQKLANGKVVLDKHQLIKILERAMSKEVLRSLPVSTRAIPKGVVEYSKGIKLPVIKIAIQKGPGNVSWIDKLLQIPIPDCRHRTVNLILAPYFVNVKKLEVDKATEAISNYITFCKTVNPDTKITDRYIRYQCEYAKSHGLRPLSLTRARNELGSGIDFNILLGEEEKVSA